MNPNSCPICHSPIPAEAPGGFCPVCLLREAEDGPPPARRAPGLDEVQAAFPQLEVLSLIGQGGMGFVFKARQPALDRVVALKILCPELGRDAAFAERFAREARVLGKLNHPNIVTVFEHGQAGPFFYLVMEFVEGVNLRQAMRAGRFTPEQALAVVPGICDALQAAHAQGVWHRDIKPENILLDQQGAVKIVDFGIARLIGDPARDFTLTLTGAALGSAPYMAPEQHEHPHEVDHRADIYSLGVVIYEMLTGELPLGRFPAPSERAAVSARIDEIVLQTLEKERELRQQSAAEVKTDVTRATRGGQATEAATPPDKPARSRFSTLPRLVLWSIGLWIGGAVMAGVGGGIMEGLRSAAAGGAVVLAVGAVAAVLGFLGCLWSLYEMKRGWMPTTGRGVLIALTVAPLLVAPAVGAFALLMEGDIPRQKGGLLLVSGITFVGLCLANWVILLLGRPLSPTTSRRRWLGALALTGAFVFLLGSSVFAKRWDGNWPFAHDRTDGSMTIQQCRGSLSDQELLALARQAAGPYADDFAIGLSNGNLKVSVMTPVEVRTRDFGQSPHVEAFWKRLAPLLPTPPENWTWFQHGFRSFRSEINDWVGFQAAGLVAASLLASLAGGRRFWWFLLGGLCLHGALALAPLWPPDPALRPRLVTGPPLPLFQPTELPQNADFSTPEAACKSLIDAHRRGQVKVVRGGLSKALVAVLDENKEWDELLYRRGVVYQDDTSQNPERSPGRCRMGNTYLVQEDGQWKVDSLNYMTPKRGSTGPFTRSEQKKVETSAPKPPPAPAEPSVPVEDVFRRMNQFANESNGEEFMKHKYKPMIAFGDVPAITYMEPFFGEIVDLRREPLRSYDSAEIRRLIASMKRADGTLHYRSFPFTQQEGNWRLLSDDPPLYRASCRIEFRPEKGQAEAILRTHLGGKPLKRVPGLDDQFDVVGEETEANVAVRTAERVCEQLHDSLAKAGLDRFFKVIRKAEQPATPWMGEDSPPLAKTSVMPGPAEAMKALLEAARNHNGLAFHDGLSKAWKEEMRKAGHDAATNFGDFERADFVEAKQVDDHTAEVVVEGNLGDLKKRATFRMVIEDGGWKLDGRP